MDISPVPKPTKSNRPPPNWRRAGWIAGIGVLILWGIVWTVAPGPLHRKPPPPVVTMIDTNGVDPGVFAYLQTIIAAAKRTPNDPKSRASLGLAYAANGFWREARLCFLDTAQMAPKEPLAPLYAGIASQELSDESGACSAFRQVASHFPSFARAWYRVGEAALRRGDWPEAAHAFRRLMDLAPAEWRGPAGLGEALLRQGRPADARPFLEQAVQIDWGAKPAHYLLGQAYRQLGLTNEASISVALGSSDSRQPMPDSWAAEAPRHMRLLADLIGQAEQLSTEGQHQQAVEILRSALPFHAKNPVLLNQMAIVLDRAGTPSEALAWANRAAGIDPGLVAVRVTRALVQSHLGQFPAALADVGEALRLAPCLTQAHLAEAEIWLAQDRDLEAISALKRAIACDPKNAEIEVELGDVLWRNLGEKEEAERHYQQALSLNPALLRAHVQLGKLQKNLGRNEEARETCARLKQFAPQSPELADLVSALERP